MQHVKMIHVIIQYTELHVAIKSNTHILIYGLGIFMTLWNMSSTKRASPRNLFASWSQ